ncbi:phage holin family protein [uncultured Parabacteroides sp.]|jgi:phage-related holin|uniref:phage holin family protein n=1 Tax=uncultured Parabacteroides sp. TaxID=512312 RepID=UPI00205C1F75|nr:phage holin family protein [uncultured Parabacteroides sp.]DAJ56798.1 MAG TPA: holin [Caudoviricetes sp.]
MERIIHLNITQDITHGTTIIFICAILTIVASFIDMWTGIDAARVNKEPISSRSLRKTIAKIVDYLRVVLFAVLIDVLGLFFPWYAIPYCAIVVTLGILLIEGRSVVENSKKKKSHAGEVAEMVVKIIECVQEKDAEEIIKVIKEKGGKNEK